MAVRKAPLPGQLVVIVRLCRVVREKPRASLAAVGSHEPPRRVSIPVARAWSHDLVPAHGPLAAEIRQTFGDIVHEGLDKGRLRNHRHPRKLFVGSSADPLSHCHSDTLRSETE